VVGAVEGRLGVQGGEVEGLGQVELAGGVEAFGEVGLWGWAGVWVCRCGDVGGGGEMKVKVRMKVG
jgi:hypothetical protein